MKIISKDLRDGEKLPERHVFNGMGYQGDNISPHLAWDDVPAGTKSFVVTCYDPDAPTGSGWWHWIVANLPADTRVLHSPILNVFVNGSLCWGNIPTPRALAISSIPEFERAVFDSWSTHPNPGQEFTISGKGGLVRLWDGLAARRAKRFPIKRLKPFGAGARQGRRSSTEPVTVGRIIGGAK